MTNRMLGNQSERSGRAFRICVSAFLLAAGVVLVATGCSTRSEKSSQGKELSDASLRRILSSSAKAMRHVNGFKCQVVEVKLEGDDTTTTTRHLEWQKSGRFFEKDSTGREYYLVGDIVYARESTAEPWQKMVIPKAEEKRYRPERRLPVMPERVIDDLGQSQNLTDLGEEKIGNQKCWVINFLFKPSTEHGKLRSAETVWISKKDSLVMKFERTWQKSVFERGSYHAIYSDYNQPFKIIIPKELDIQE